MKAALAIFMLTPMLATSCKLHVPWTFLDCYTKETDYIGWVYGIMSALVFVSSVVSLKLYTLINFSWNQYTDDLPEYPHHQDDLPLNIVLPQPPRPPSVISYFKFAGEDD